MIELLSDKRRLKLVQAWLDELNLLHRLSDDATEAERKKFLSRAENAAEAVERAFVDLHVKGSLKELNGRYKKARLVAKATGSTVRPWSTYVTAEQIKMIRAMARSQVIRARRGVKP